MSEGSLNINFIVGISTTRRRRRRRRRTHKNSQNVAERILHEPEVK